MVALSYLIDRSRANVLEANWRSASGYHEIEGMAYTDNSVRLTALAVSPMTCLNIPSASLS